MKNELLIEALKTEAAKSQVFNAVCHVFAFRQRARLTLTVGGLAQAMKREGFNYTTDDYIGVIETLGRLELGELQKNRNGRTSAITKLKITLQSIGAAACSGLDKLKDFKAKPKFQRLIVPKSETALAHQVRPPVSLTVLVNDKPLTLTIPKEMNENDVVSIVKFFRSVQ